MSNSRLKIAVCISTILLLIGAFIAFRLLSKLVNDALAERNAVGFVVTANAVVFRTPNSELLAPAWNEPVTLADPATFNTLYHSTAFCLGADRANVYMGEGRRVYRLSNCQASTFRLLTPDARFACDAQHVYFMGFELPQADPASFQVLGRFISKDANQVYVGPMVLPKADPDTFQVEYEGNLPDLNPAYGEGPCTIRQFRREHSLEIKDFRGRDKHRQF